MSEDSNQHSVWGTEELFEKARLGIPPRDSGRSPTHPDNLAATEAIAALKELEVQYAELRDDRDGKGFLRDAAEAKVRRLEEQLEALRDELERIALDPARAFSLIERGIVAPAPAIPEDGTAGATSSPASALSGACNSSPSDGARDAAQRPSVGAGEGAASYPAIIPSSASVPATPGDGMAEAEASFPAKESQ